VKYFVFIVLFSTAALADDPQPHYPVQLPDSYRQALHQMETVSKQLEAAEREDDLRRMHELSYQLEASLEKMQEDLDAVAKDVEAMHVASERDEKAKAKEAYKKLAPKVQALSP